MTFLQFMHIKADFILRQAMQAYFIHYDPKLPVPTIKLTEFKGNYKLTLTSHLTLDGQSSTYIIEDTGESSFFTKIRHLIDLLDKER